MAQMRVHGFRHELAGSHMGEGTVAVSVQVSKQSQASEGSRS